MKLLLLGATGVVGSNTLKLALANAGATRQVGQPGARTSRRGPSIATLREG